MTLNLSISWWVIKTLLSRRACASGADDLFEKFGQSEFWVQGFCHPHSGESSACPGASDREERTSAKCFSILGPQTLKLALLCSLLRPALSAWLQRDVASEGLRGAVSVSSRGRELAFPVC